MKSTISGDPGSWDRHPYHHPYRATRSSRFDFIRVPFAMVLVLATAMALFASGWILSNPTVADPRPASADVVVQAFYSAVNQTVRSGDASALDATFDEHAQTHGPLATIAPDRAGITRYLLSLHATNPQLELRVADMAITGSRAVVDLEVLGTKNGSFLGGSLHELTSWGAVDGLRIGNGRVLEFWSDASSVALLQTLAEAPATLTQVDRRDVTLNRLAIPPGSSFVATGQDDLYWLIGESGTVTVTVTPTTPPLMHPPTALESDRRLLHTGELLALQTKSKTEIDNTGRQPASLLVLTLVAPYPPAVVSSPFYASGSFPTTDISLEWLVRASNKQQGETTFESVTSGVTEALPVDHEIIRLAQVTLAPGTVLSDFDAAGLSLLAVQSGTLDLVFEDQLTKLNQTTGSYHNIERLQATDGATLLPGSHASFHNPGPDPVVITFIALLPVGVTAGGNA